MGHPPGDSLCGWVNSEKDGRLNDTPMSAKPKVIDLFCGAGGFTLASWQAGFECVAGFDASEVLSSRFLENFPKSRFIKCDLQSAEVSEVLRSAGLKAREIDGIVGGPPCQGFSWIGRRQSDDPRNTLIHHFFRLVSGIKPRFFVMENVPGLLHKPFSVRLKRELARLSDRYSLLGPLLLDSADFGAATRRQRILIIGIDSRYVDPIAKDDLVQRFVPTKSTVRDAIHDLPEPVLVSEKNSDGWAGYGRDPFCDERGLFARKARTAPPAHLGSLLAREFLAKGLVSGFQFTEHTQEVVSRFDSVPAGGTDSISRFPRLDWDEQCPTLRAGTGPENGSFQSVRPIHPKCNRVITVREAARLQGFPDWFLFHPTKWHSFRMIGNSVNPQMANEILTAIRTRL